MFRSVLIAFIAMTSLYIVFKDGAFILSVLLTLSVLFSIFYLIGSYTPTTPYVLHSF